jgi:hypothetical protein
MIVPARRKLSFEGLESKQMLAGNVVVNLTGGNLFVTGDEAGNQISITAGTDANTFVIKGLEGTTVTLAGSSTPAPETGLVVTGVRGHVNVNLKEGADAVEASQAEFRRGLSIETGAGNDTVDVHDVKVGSFLSIVTGADDDNVDLGTAAAPTGLLASDAAASVKAGLAINVLLGDGVDNAQVNSVTAPAVTVGGGLGADTIGVHGVRAVSLIARGGDGDAADTVDVSAAKALAAIIGTGAGADDVTIGSSEFTSLNVALGAGDDGLSLQGVKARVAVLTGGEGASDELTDAGDNSLKLRVVTGLEIPENANTSRPLPRLGGLLSSLFARLFR